MLLPHRLVLPPSRSLAMVLVIAHMIALACLTLVSLPFPPWLELTLATLVAVSAGISIRRHALRQAGSSIRELTLKADGTVEAVHYGGGRFDARVSGQSTALPWLIVILLELPGVRRFDPLVILPDALPVEDGRILRAWLRWKLT